MNRKDRLDRELASMTVASLLLGAVALAGLSLETPNPVPRIAHYRADPAIPGERALWTELRPRAARQDPAPVQQAGDLAGLLLEPRATRFAAALACPAPRNFYPAKPAHPAN